MVLQISESLFLQFGWTLVFAVAAGMAAVRLKIPPVIGLLFFGMLAGPNVLGLVKAETIDVLAEFGAVLLLFMIGVQFSVAKLLSTGLRAIFAGLSIMAATFVFLYELSLLAGFDFITSLYLGAMLSLSSTAIIIKILEQRGFINRIEVPFIMAILIVEDVVAVFLLTMFSGLKGGSLTTGNILLSIAVSISVLLFTYVILQNLLKRFSDIFLRYQAEDTLVFFSFALGVGMSIIASMLGLTPSIGAFLAGSIIASLPKGQEFEQAIKPFSLVFSSFFFLSIGMLIDPMGVFRSAGLVALFIGAFVVAISFVTAFFVYLASSNTRSAIFSGLVMLPLGEFSLLIAKQGAGIVSLNLVEIAAVGVLITSILSSVLIRRHEQAYAVFRNAIPSSAILFMKSASVYFDRVMRAFEPDGYIYNIASAHSRTISFEALYLAAASAAIALAHSALDFEIPIFGFMLNPRFYYSAVLALFALQPLLKVLAAAKKTFDAAVTVIIRSSDRLTAIEMMRNTALAYFFFILSFNAPVAVTLLKLPKLFNLVSLPVALLGVFFIWATLRAIPSKIGILLSGKDKEETFQGRIILEQEDIIIDDITPAEKAPAKKPRQKQKRRKLTAK
jgi:Kef-type K+ transport system membrane component KefB